MFKTGLLNQGYTGTKLSFSEYKQNLDSIRTN